MSMIEKTRQCKIALGFVVATAGFSMVSTPSAALQICLNSNGTFNDILKKLQKYDDTLETVFRSEDGENLFYCVRDKGGEFTIWKYNDKAKTICDPTPAPNCPEFSIPMS